MTHPEDLLAEYVDGTLPDALRADVDAHLATCARCREEVAAAARAVSALAALPEEPVPLGVTGPVVAESERTHRPVARRRPAWERSRWAGGVAAAAALLLVAAVLLPQLTGRSADDEAAEGGSTRAPTAEAGDAALGATAQAVELEVLDRSLDDDDLRSLAREAAEAAPAFPEREDAATLASPDPAISCFAENGITIDDREMLVRAIEAAYLGTPAYVGVFQEGPGGGEPPEKILVWVVSSPDCTLLTATSQRI
ncbi:MAG TPA: zf-HC2 domain-containing protein [Actinomycetota bacterium]|nr:zf-HC2 domain-containing protein [Actinomycetota bacterium]